jgi:hypothetical protein
MAMAATNDLPDEMNSYERTAWTDMQQHWQEKAERRALLPPKARSALESAGQRSRAVIAQTGEKIGEYTPKSAARVASRAFDGALIPTVKAAVHLIELAEQWTVELTNPEFVLRHHQKKGRHVAALNELRTVELEHLDELTRRMTLQWRTLGAAEGGALGTLSLIPVAGGALAIGADLVVIQMLSTAIAARSVYAYGFDAKHPLEQHMIERIVRRGYAQQTGKVGALNSASRAFEASKGRIRWSQKLRDDHRLMAAIERLTQHVRDGKVGVQQARKGIPFVSIATGAGTNAYVLGDVAKQGVLYSRTRFLAEKYNLPLPPNLIHPVDVDHRSDNDETVPIATTAKKVAVAPKTREER